MARLYHHLLLSSGSGSRDSSKSDIRTEVHRLSPVFTQPALVLLQSRIEVSTAVDARSLAYSIGCLTASFVTRADKFGLDQGVAPPNQTLHVRPPTSSPNSIRFGISASPTFELDCRSADSWTRHLALDAGGIQDWQWPSLMR